MALRSSDEDIGYLQAKISILALVVMVFIAVVVARLYYLQVHRGEQYRNLSEQLSVREQEVRAVRGRIFDRHGQLLADSRPYYEIAAVPQFLLNKKKAFASLTRLLPLSEQTLEEEYGKAKTHAPFYPVVLAEDAPYDWVAQIKEYQRPSYEDSTNIFLQGIEVQASRLRTYLYPELFSHVLGYLKEVDQGQLDRLQVAHPEHYSRGDLIGASGLEGAYDLSLRGHDGVDAKVVDARGRAVYGDSDLDILALRVSEQAKAGSDLYATLDFSAQQAAQTAFAERRGAAVAMDPHTGEVLVMFSSPGFDANRIIKTVDKPYWQQINLHEDKFLFNRAIQAAYPPGSIYKMVPALAALDTENITPETSFYCGGGYQFGSRRFKCWNAGGHGQVSLLKGIAQSCDVYFYNLGLRVGVDTLHDYAHIFGMGEKTGIEIASENAGLIPSSAWKEKRFKTPWIASETLSIAIGQGYDLVTPLQAAKMVAMIANGGYNITPHLGLKLYHLATKESEWLKPPGGEKKIKDEYVKLLQQGMINVIHGEGTARRLQQSPNKIAGKTGTAQVVGHDSKLAASEKTKPHGWFVAYAPYDDPKIAVAVIVENGGGGGAVAGPVAMTIIDTYLESLKGKR